MTSSSCPERLGILMLSWIVLITLLKLSWLFITGEVVISLILFELRDFILINDENRNEYG
jgi:hypothetical protein